MINQRLLPPTFPRLIRVHSYESTMSELKTVFQQLSVALKVIGIGHFNELFDFCLSFSVQNQSVLLRSIVQVEACE